MVPGRLVGAGDIWRNLNYITLLQTTSLQFQVLASPEIASLDIILFEITSIQIFSSKLAGTCQRGCCIRSPLGTKLCEVVLFHEDITQLEQKNSSHCYTCGLRPHRVSAMSVHYFWRYKQFSEPSAIFWRSDFTAICAAHNQQPGQLSIITINITSETT